jgi:hypothetical protein
LDLDLDLVVKASRRRRDELSYSRRTTIPKTKIRRTNPTVIKKLNFKSGNISVSRIPSVSITGFTASNKMTDVAIRRPIITSFNIIDEIEPDLTDNGLTKKRRTRSKETPNMVHEYLVFSLY